MIIVQIITIENENLKKKNNEDGLRCQFVLKRKKKAIMVIRTMMVVVSLDKKKKKS